MTIQEVADQRHQDLVLVFQHVVAGVFVRVHFRLRQRGTEAVEEMALRLEGWLGVENGGSADAWIAQQAAYDLWKARAAGAPVVQRAPEVATT